MNGKKFYLKKFIILPVKKEQKGPEQGNIISTVRLELTIAQYVVTRFLKVTASLIAVADGQVFLNRSQKTALFIFPIILLE